MKHPTEEELAKLASQHEFIQEWLDDMVYHAFNVSASAVNNAGPAHQIEYLIHNRWCTGADDMWDQLKFTAEEELDPEDRTWTKRN